MRMPYPFGSFLAERVGTSTAEEPLQFTPATNHTTFELRQFR